MKFKRYDKRFLPMLWIGLGIWVVSMVLGGILESSGLIEGQSGLMEMAKWLFQRWPVGTLLLMCLFQPVLEEFSFRLWGVGKMWMTIVCLALMAVFTASEMSVFGLVFVGAFVFVWLKVKDTFKQRWINAVITSLAFALCHISGFGGFGWGMVLGLLDIFGMALVMCWLTINLNFWFSCLLHVGNNSIAILWGLLFVGDPVANSYTFDDEREVSTELRAFDALRDDSEALLSANDDEESCVYVWVGEPAEVAAEMLRDAKWSSEDFSTEPYYDWVSRNEDIEERIVYRVYFPDSEPPSPREQLEAFLKDYEAYSEEALAFDTTEAELQDINLVYRLGGDSYDTVNVNRPGLVHNNFDDACDRVERDLLGRTPYLFVPYAGAEEDMVLYYALPTTRGKSVLKEMMGGYDDTWDVVYGFGMEYVPTGKMVKLITVK